MTGVGRLDLVLRPLILATMVGCLALALSWLLRMPVPTWNSTPLVLACVLAALDADYSRRLLRARQLDMAERWRFRAVEVVVYLIVFRIVSYGFNPSPDLMVDLQAWARNPLSVFSIDVWLSFCVALLFWLQVNETIEDLERIGEPVLVDNYVSPYESLTSRYFMGGVVLLLLTAFVQIADQFGWRPSPGVVVVLNVLVYFMLGLALLGQVRLTALRQAWEARSMTWPAELAPRWARYTAVFLLLAVLGAAVLPTRYSLGLLGLVGTLVILLWTLLTWLVVTPVIVVALLLYQLFARLFPGLPDVPPPPPPPPIDPQVAPPAALPPWLEIARSVFFWIIIVVMVVYVFRSYLRDHPELMRAVRSLGFVRALRDWWAALRSRMTGWALAAAERWPRRSSRALSSDAEPRGLLGFFRLGGLSPREQVRYYYLRLLRRAAEHGFPRRPSQTPAEYQPTLDARLPEVRTETTALTEAFIRARYSPHAVEAAQARHARSYWERIRAALQVLKRSTD